MHPGEMEPLMPEQGPLEELAFEVLRSAAALAAVLPDRTRDGVVELVRIVATHYSNFIEGHNTHPVDIERALRAEFTEDTSVRALQREAAAHIEVHHIIESLLANGFVDICSADFFKLVHREFYERVPEEFRWVHHPDDPARKERVIPGEFRTHGVRVGAHIAPDPVDLEALLSRFRVAYDPAALSPVDRLLAVGASHHRLLWIHPFMDGNGRVARLFSGAYATRAGIEGGIGGLWSASRGLARARARYREMLAAADEERRNDLDGRGALSLRTLNAFCRFYLDVCLDQIAFMRASLRLETLGDRLMEYAVRRSTGMAPGSRMEPEAGSMLREVALRGEVARGEAARVMALPVSEARKVLSGLVKENLLASDTPKGPVRLGFPAHAVPYFFPDLYYPDVVSQGTPRSRIEGAG
jgi:Fic family protein